jgi:hypothetical protein
MINAPFNCVDLGGNMIQTATGQLFSIAGFGNASVKNTGKNLFSSTIYDADGTEAIIIRDNEYTLCRSTWDIEYVSNVLTLRNAPRTKFAEITFDADRKQIVLRGQVRINDTLNLKITDSGIFVGERLLAANNFVSMCRRGIVIERRPQIRPFLVSASVSGCAFDSTPGAALFNTYRSVGNTVRECSEAMVWATEFLEDLAHRA